MNEPTGTPIPYSQVASIPPALVDPMTSGNKERALDGPDMLGHVWRNGKCQRCTLIMAVALCEPCAGAPVERCPVVVLASDWESMQVLHTEVRMLVRALRKAAIPGNAAVELKRVAALVGLGE